MGVLLAHTVVVVLDQGWLTSQWCAGELRAFRENCRLLGSEHQGVNFGSRQLENKAADNQGFRSLKVCF